MEGGIKAWQGFTAEGMPELGLSFFSSAGSPREYVAIAWQLEEGTRRFYEKISVSVQDPNVVHLFRQLANAEEHHQETLAGLYTEFTGKKLTLDSLQSDAPGLESGKFMESGIRLDEGLRWAQDRNEKDILELSIGLEANAYDRYHFMRQQVEHQGAKKVFHVLANEERVHLNRLADLLDRML